MDTAHPNHSFISSEDVERTGVYDRNNSHIGEVDHRMIDKPFGLGGAVTLWPCRTVMEPIAWCHVNNR